MHPWLIWTEHVKLPTYISCIVLGATLATFVFARQVRRSPLPRRALFDLALLALPAGFAGARLFLVFEDPIRYLGDPMQLLWWSGGWVFYGAFLGAAAVLMWAAAWRGLPPWAVVDVFTPALPFGLAFGRLGCLGAGCCHGRPADWPLGVEVPWSVRYFHAGYVPESLRAVSLHPSPLYEALLGLALFWLTTRVSRRRHFDGQVLLTLVLGYGIGRFVLEFFRGDLERGMHLGGWLSSGQLTALFTLAVGGALYLRRRRACSPS